MNWDTTKRVTCYVVITAVISIIGQLDSMGFDFAKLNASLCVGMVLKAMLPGLVSVKALFDDTLNQSKEPTNE